MIYCKGIHTYLEATKPRAASRTGTGTTGDKGRTRNKTPRGQRGHATPWEPERKTRPQQEQAANKERQGKQKTKLADDITEKFIY